MSSFKKKLLKINSIRFHTFLFLFLVGILPLLVSRYAVFKTFEEREVSMRTIEITSQSKLLATEISSTGYLFGNPSEGVDAKISMLSNIYDGRVMIIDQNYKIIADTFNMDKGKTITSKAVVTSFAGNVNSSYDASLGYIELTMPVKDLENKSVIGVLVISVSSDSIVVNRTYYNGQYDILMLFLTVVIFIAAVAFSALLTNPLRRLIKALKERHEGIEEEDLVGTGTTETEEIAEEINKVLNDYRTLDQSRQEFVSNVSHELKTPITSIKVLADSLVAMGDVPIELYQEFMTDITAEIDRESQIISDLLSLVKMDKSAASLNIEEVSVNDLLSTVLKRLTPIADKASVSLVLESFRPVNAEIDQVKIMQSFTNLVENGIKYNKPEGGTVKVTLNADHQYFYVTVEDTGIGIPEDSVDHIFERFYRVDKSHSREIGGTGLGLAITRRSILLHRGAIKVHSELDVGTTFSVRIPLKYIA